MTLLQKTGIDFSEERMLAEFRAKKKEENSCCDELKDFYLFQNKPDKIILR